MEHWWDGWVAETNSLLNCRTGNCTTSSNLVPTAKNTYGGGKEKTYTERKKRTDNVQFNKNIEDESFGA